MTLLPSRNISQIQKESYYIPGFHALLMHAPDSRATYKDDMALAEDDGGMHYNAAIQFEQELKKDGTFPRNARERSVDLSDKGHHLLYNPKTQQLAHAWYRSPEKDREDIHHLNYFKEKLEEKGYPVKEYGAMEISTNKNEGRFVFEPFWRKENEEWNWQKHKKEHEERQFHQNKDRDLRWEITPEEQFPSRLRLTHNEGSIESLKEMTKKQSGRDVVLDLANKMGWQEGKRSGDGHRRFYWTHPESKIEHMVQVGGNHSKNSEHIDVDRLKKRIRECMNGTERCLHKTPAKVGNWKFADYNGWTNWETWNTVLMIDNEQETYNEINNLIRKGSIRTPQHLENWAIQRIVGLHNKQAIEDAQSWNDIHPDERIDYHYEDLKNNSPDAANFVNQLGFGPDISDVDPMIIDPNLVNWQEILQSKIEDIKKEDEYNKSSDDDTGIGW